MTKEHHQSGRSLGNNRHILPKEHSIIGDLFDIRLRKIEMAWDLASRLIPPEPADSGAWTPDVYLKKAQETLKQAREIIEAVFKDA